MSIQYWNGKNWITVKNDEVEKIRKSLEEIGFCTLSINNQTLGVENSIIKALLDSDRAEEDWKNPSFEK